MVLDIYTTDDSKICYCSAYSTFFYIRALFAAHYDKSFYQNYLEHNSISFDKVGNLVIILNHSDCDGELTSEECQKLLPCLIIDEEIISSIYNGRGYSGMIAKMQEFKNIVEYCAKNSDVKLIFG